MKTKFYRWLITNIAKTPEGNILPLWIRCIWMLLFPIKAFYYRIERNEGYQPITDTWKIQGNEFSGQFFQHLERCANDSFRIVTRSNGTITIERN